MSKRWFDPATGVERVQDDAPNPGWLAVITIQMPDGRQIDSTLQSLESWLATSPAGYVVDYDSIHAALIEAAEQYNLQGVAYDPWNATQAAVKLEAEGVEMLEFRQGYRTMSGPAKAFEAAALDHKARHNDNPVLNWMVGNTMVEMDPAENIKPSKKKSTQRIDGVVASVMAYGLALAANDDDDTSVYEDRGLLTL